MTTATVENTDRWLETIWPRPDTGPQTLVLGIGGGSDGLTAWALSAWLDTGCAYGNTKNRHEEDWLPLAPPRLFSLPGPATPVSAMSTRNGTTGIDRALPRGGALGSPLIALMPKNTPPDEMGAALASTPLRHIIAVDTGGDALPRPRRPFARGRDGLMLAAIAASGLPATLFIAGLGADGQIDASVLEERFQHQVERGRYLGAMPLEPLREHLEALAPGLPERRTPRIILSALDARGDSFTVPRGKRPQVPTRWLTHGFAFALPLCGLRGLPQTRPAAVSTSKKRSWS